MQVTNMHKLYHVLMLMLLFLLLPAREVVATSTSLYNGIASPGSQGFFYLAQPLGSASAIQLNNNLDTTPQSSDSAGFFARANLMPTLDRQAGYTVRFGVQLNAENHANSDKNGDGIGDRAGFSLIVLSSDKQGIELGFWTDRVWAQNDGTSIPPTGSLFTHAEEAVIATTQPISYDLHIQGNMYTLKNGATVILTGPLRNYTAFSGPINPYSTPNLLFLGDNTSSAAANVTFTGPITITNNSLPSMTPVNTIALFQGAPEAVMPIATVSDAEDVADSLQVQVVSQPAGITVIMPNNSNINGSISASIVAGCESSLGSNTVGLRVTDSMGATTDANLIIMIHPSLAPTLGSYANTTVTLGDIGTVTPDVPPTHNDPPGIVTASAPGFAGLLSVNQAGVLSITNAQPAGSYLVTLSTANTCGSQISTSFTLTVTELTAWRVYIPLVVR